MTNQQLLNSRRLEKISDDFTNNPRGDFWQYYEDEFYAICEFLGISVEHDTAEEMCLEFLGDY